MGVVGIKNVGVLECGGIKEFRIGNFGAVELFNGTLSSSTWRICAPAWTITSYFSEPFCSRSLVSVELVNTSWTIRILVAFSKLSREAGLM